ncbi:hypothetical protein PILCRDRAFT_819567 [Piloderma croceum F 1598]|uniref:Uncharacterized protein n=1 Tax=Piloderma croceum (strain F 1598) TaxID=765440 RepID=A0A0C3BAJ8_PILCF|nr:hypothetical protein PILCRDRAFT_819567 [Piloderma croceum F 1598]
MGSSERTQNKVHRQTEFGTGFIVLERQEWTICRISYEFPHAGCHVSKHGVRDSPKSTTLNREAGIRLPGIVTTQPADDKDEVISMSRNVHQA